MFDFAEFFNVSVKGIPLFIVVILVVEFLKSYGVSGRALLVSCLITGLVLGGGYQLSQNWPTDFAGWFGAIFYGLALGLVANKSYDLSKKISAKGSAEVLGLDAHGKG